MELTIKFTAISRNISLMVPLLLVSYRKRPVETVMESYGTWYGTVGPKPRYRAVRGVWKSVEYSEAMLDVMFDDTGSLMVDSPWKLPWPERGHPAGYTHMPRCTWR